MMPSANADLRLARVRLCMLSPASYLLPAYLLQDPHRRVPARRAHDAAAGMRRRAAHVEVANRRPVLRPARRRAQEEQLLERQLALKDVAFGQARTRARGRAASAPAGAG